MHIKSNLLRKFLYFFAREKSAINSMRMLVEFMLSEDGLDDASSFTRADIVQKTAFKSSPLTISIRKLLELSVLQKQEIKGKNHYKINPIYAPPTNKIPISEIDNKEDYEALKQNLYIISQDNNLQNSHRILLEYWHAACYIQIWTELSLPTQVCKELDMYNSTFHKARKYLESKGYIKIQIERAKQRYYIPKYQLPLVPGAAINPTA